VVTQCGVSGRGLLVGFGTTLPATGFGTLTAIGLSSDKLPARRMIMPLLISPLVVPVVITVSAGLTGFDRNLLRAAAICGAKPATGFFRVMLPLILPGVLSGAAFAFVTSCDEVVVVQFLASASQRTLPLARRRICAGAA
jgi:putative spermidine/putrescine transport system permease protein